MSMRTLIEYYLRNTIIQGNGDIMNSFEKYYYLVFCFNLDREVKTASQQLQLLFQYLLNGAQLPEYDEKGLNL